MVAVANRIGGRKFMRLTHGCRETRKKALAINC